jgi:cell wall-associated NlpC family hydrolase
MNQIKIYILLWIMVWMSFSCAAHKKAPFDQHIPPEQTQDSQDFLKSNQRKIIAQYAVNSLGLPYQWGGHSPETGLDCSGLVVYTHQMADIIVPRTASAQYENGRIITIQNLQIADLVFFKDMKGNKNYHVGIYMGDGRFIHAPGRGRTITYEFLNTPYFLNRYIGSRSYL